MMVKNVVRLVSLGTTMSALRCRPTRAMTMSAVVSMALECAAGGWWEAIVVFGLDKYPWTSSNLAAHPEPPLPSAASVEQLQSAALLALPFHSVCFGPADWRKCCSRAWHASGCLGVQRFPFFVLRSSHQTSNHPHFLASRRFPRDSASARFYPVIIALSVTITMI